MSETALATYAGELKAWRERMGLTQQAFADKLGYSAALVAAVEQCKRSPTADFAATHARPGPATARESYPAFFAPVLAFEHDAVRIHGWEIGAVPGLLQCESYARALLRSVRQGSEDELERHVQARLERKTILFADKPVALWYVLDEGTLRRMIGGPDVMRDQLDCLIESAASMILQVLPFTASDQPGADGPITVYDFADAPSVCYTECYSGGRIVEGHAEVADLMRIVNLLRASALPPHESLQLIRQIRRDLDNDR
jgi:transcriptional regulator with XRE-family HTH domain